MYTEDLSWLYDEDRDWPFQVALAKYTIRQVPIDDMCCLDTGSGRGGFCSFLRRYYSPRATIGMDIHRRQQTWTSRRFAGTGMRLVTGDAQRLPFVSESFDVVTNLESVLHYRNRRCFFAEARRVLRRDGYLCLSCNVVDPEDVTADMQSVGFTLVEVTDITEWIVKAATVDSRRIRELLLRMAKTDSAKTSARRLATRAAASAQLFTARHRYCSWIVQAH